MTGAEHYREAEMHLNTALRDAADNSTAEQIHIQYAQVHATLALAAAQAWPVVDRYKGDSYLTNEWSDAIGWIIPADLVEDDE